MPQNITIRLCSWNVNGLRAAEKKGFFDWLHREKPDIIGLQETKAQPDQLSEQALHPDGYESFWNSALRKGYSGTVVYSRLSPLMAMTAFGSPFLDGEGRIILLEFDQFFYFNVYFPNGGSGPDRLAFKLRFYDEFLSLMESFRKKKPIVLCGDINTAHHDIDLARPKENANTSGFMPIERAWLDRLEKHGYIDTFRLFEKDGGHYTWWDMVTRSRERNVGWRIDMFYVSEELRGNVQAAKILSDVHGSDHCPITLELGF